MLGFAPMVDAAALRRLIAALPGAGALANGAEDELAALLLGALRLAARRRAAAARRTRSLA